MNLKQEVGKRWPMTSRLDILKENALRTNFPDLLTSVASRERLPRDVLNRRLIFCLYSLGTNTGFKHLPRDDLSTTYSDLQPILTKVINWDLIRNQYDEMIKYATGLRLRTEDTESILQRFTRNKLQHPTYQALAELGRAIKTIFLCQYLESEELHREIHERLNVVEMVGMC